MLGLQALYEAKHLRYLKTTTSNKAHFRKEFNYLYRTLEMRLQEVNAVLQNHLTDTKFLRGDPISTEDNVVKDSRKTFLIFGEPPNVLVEIS